MIIVAFLAIFYACAVVVAGIFGLIMVALGKFTMAEARAYALFSEYPRHWFKTAKESAIRKEP